MKTNDTGCGIAPENSLHLDTEAETQPTHGEFARFYQHLGPTKLRYDDEAARVWIGKLIDDPALPIAETPLKGKTLANVIPAAREILVSGIPRKRAIYAGINKRRQTKALEFVLRVTGHTEAFGLASDGCFKIRDTSKPKQKSSDNLPELPPVEPMSKRLTPALGSPDATANDVEKAALCLVEEVAENVGTAKAYLFNVILAITLVGLLLRKREEQFPDESELSPPKRLVALFGAVLVQLGMSMDEWTINRGINTLSEILLDELNLSDIPSMGNQEAWKNFWKTAVVWIHETTEIYKIGKLTPILNNRLYCLPAMHRVLRRIQGKKSKVDNKKPKAPQAFLNDERLDRALEYLAKLEDQQEVDLNVAAFSKCVSGSARALKVLGVENVRECIERILEDLDF
jgi:hypothetical protein